MWFHIVFIVIAFNIVRTGHCRQIIFCPNMGRFGNQLDHYTSMLHLSKLVNRKLILSPLIDYSNGFNPIEFTKIFNITFLRNASICLESIASSWISGVTYISCDVYLVISVLTYLKEKFQCRYYE